MNEITVFRYSIPETGQILVGNLRVSAGNFWEETIKDQVGNTWEGITCGLWFSDKTNPEFSLHIRAFPSQTIEVAGYRICVDSIDKHEGQLGNVQLEIKQS